MCVGKNTAQAANVRAQRVRCSGLYLFEKMLAFLREPVDFVDRLKRTAPRLLRAGALCVGNRGRERENRRSALFRSKEVCVPGQGREAPTDWPKR